MSEPAKIWNVMTRTYGGVVSLLKNLTEDEARGVMQRLRRPWDSCDPWSDHQITLRAERDAKQEAERAKGGGIISFGTGQTFPCSNSDLEQIECWGPEGRTLEVWPKPADYEARYAAALDAARAALQEQES